MAIVLTPDHPNWWGFIHRLRIAISGKPLGGMCQHDWTNTIKILRSLHNIEVQETLELFAEYGGLCDCEVLAYVQAGWEEDK